MTGACGVWRIDAGAWCLADRCLRKVLTAEKYRKRSQHCTASTTGSGSIVSAGSTSRAEAMLCGVAEHARETLGEIGDTAQDPRMIESA